MAKDNPLDLTEVAEKYNWENTKDIKISFVVKSCRGSADASTQFYCWIRDYFRDELIFELDEKYHGKFLPIDSDETKLEKRQREFGDDWFKLIDFEEIDNG